MFGTRSKQQEPQARPEKEAVTCGECGKRYERSILYLCGKAVSIPPVCEPCVAQYEQEDEQQRQANDAARQRQARQDGWLRVCPWPRFQSVDPNLLPQAGKDHWGHVMNWQYGPKGIGLIGLSDSGKSMLAHALAKRVYLEGKRVHITFSTQFAEDMADTEGRRRNLKACTDSDLLVFDDLDKAKITERVEADFFHVLEVRERYGRPIIITLNATSEQLKSKFSESVHLPVINRLRRMCEFHVVGQQQERS